MSDYRVVSVVKADVAFRADAVRFFFFLFYFIFLIIFIGVFL